MTQAVATEAFVVEGILRFFRAKIEQKKIFLRYFVVYLLQGVGFWVRYMQYGGDFWGDARYIFKLWELSCIVVVIIINVVGVSSDPILFADQHVDYFLEHGTLYLTNASCWALAKDQWTLEIDQKIPIMVGHCG